MNHLFNNEQKMTEIIFAHRNKAYGAYVIRSSYGETTAKAIGIMLFSITTLMGIAWHLNHSGPPSTDEKNYIPLERDTSIVFTIPPEDDPAIEKPKPADTPAGAAAAGERLATVISDSVEPTETSTVTVETQGTGNSTLSAAVGESTVAGAEGTGTVVSEVENKPRIFVDKMPEFKGGLPALMKFLRDNVRYPEEAIEMGHEGKFFVRFVVDEKGKISLPEVLNSRYSELDREALRVVKSIPNFESPGIVDGQPVKTYYQVPINFTLR